MEANDFFAKRKIRVAVTPYCNLRCVYCEGIAGYKPGKPGAMEDFRRTPLSKGSIDVDVLLDIIKVFHEAGFMAITLTGGEPLMHPQWDYIVTKSAEIGFERVEVSTNGTLLTAYIDRAGMLPKGLTLIKISFDSPDPVRYKELTGGNVNRIISAVRELSTYVRIRANKVVLRSDLGNLREYLAKCQELGFHEVNLLDLVFHPNRATPKDRAFFEKEYVPALEVREYLEDEIGPIFVPDKYGHKAVLPSGFTIILKDSNLTFRDSQCLKCPIFCQEGLYTLRIATDGNITACPDFRAELPSINGVYALKQGTLREEIDALVHRMLSAKPMKTLKTFAKIHDIHMSPKALRYL